MKNSKLFKLAALNSLGVLVYIFLISLIMNNGDRIFGSVDNEVFAPVMVLLLFVFSALLTGGLVLGKPIMLYIDGQKKEGVKLLFYTGACLFVLLALTMLIIIISK
jgi:hypothetical protein